MVTLFSGTPGSGKSLHLAQEITDELVIRKRNVICNFPINLDMITKKGKRRTGEFIYKKNDEITVDYLKEYALTHHKVGKEGQTLVIIDEAGIMFNARDHSAFDRKAWLQFFFTHRHYGFNVIIASQIDRMIDRQIRGVIEYEVRHRKANNFKFIGLLLTLFHIPLFVAVTYWYGIREKCGAEFFLYRKKYGKLYNTMMLFDGDKYGEQVGEEKKLPAEVTDGHGEETATAGGDPCRPEPSPAE